ncbi:nucleotide sugar dehydrogenase [Haloechinothrix alba]|uniref:Nucleotide sugar dehydrogenase n=1 Tax=Haloechinothrix alba TaxID=664784 RepID=A0A238UXS1_9PSEU|nr:nucleotide sugar dehydrogenase [Haloechinothrix alba]SNR26995.1 nucleotide sugar dehydrogenase [Haloechinothrix alba]
MPFTPSTDVVVIGLGYVGLPLVMGAVDAGYAVTGLDSDAGTVDALNGGSSHIDGITHADIASAVAKGFRATTDPAVLGEAGTVVVCVPTPLADDGGPDLGAVESAMRSMAEHLRPGTLVVLESTTYPGTTDEVVRPILERRGLRAGSDFNLAFSPERIDPGNPTYGLKNTPKVVGGHTGACAERCADFYRGFVDTVVTARGTREAEMAKLLENTYRHVNIALVNEMAKFCQELGVDIWDVIRCAATKPFGFQAFYPGPGVGGHCIPIDPNYLSYKVRTLGYSFRFVELAQEINQSMPGYVVRRIQDLLNEHSKPLRGSTVLLLGVTYKPDVHDQRESPAAHVARHLVEWGADVVFHDPYVPEWSVNGTMVRRAEDVDAELAFADISVLLQPHSEYDLADIAGKARLLFDTRGKVEHSDVARL